MRKVYDCFTFFNELDLLELRLNECYNDADFFVIAEANTTFTGVPKRYNLEDNWDRFKAFHDKIIYVKVDDMPVNGDAWSREYYQRNALARGIVDADDNDVIVLTDCDELLRPRTLNILRNDLEHKLWICRHPMFLYKLNYLLVKPMSYHVNPMAIVKKDFNGFQNLRNYMVGWAYRQPWDYNDANVCTIQHSGWHFTFFGDTNNAATKLMSFAHTEAQHYVNNLDIEKNIAEKIFFDSNTPERFEYVEIDDYFPKTVLDNLERWTNSIVPNANLSIRDYVPTLNLDEIYK